MNPHDFQHEGTHEQAALWHALIRCKHQTAARPRRHGLQCTSRQDQPNHCTPVPPTRGAVSLEGMHRETGYSSMIRLFTVARAFAPNRPKAHAAHAHTTISHLPQRDGWMRRGTRQRRLSCYGPTELHPCGHAAGGCIVAVNPALACLGAMGERDSGLHHTFYVGKMDGWHMNREPIGYWVKLCMQFDES